MLILKDKEEADVYVNEHQKVIFGDISDYAEYRLGPFLLSKGMQDGEYNLRHGYGMRTWTEPLHSQISKWKSLSSSRKRDLPNRYETILCCYPPLPGDFTEPGPQTFNRHRLQPPQYQPKGSLSNLVYTPPYPMSLYAPGSILTNPIRDLHHLFARDSPWVPCTLVGRVRPRSLKWDVSFCKGIETERVDLSFDNGLVSIRLSWFDLSRSIFIYIGTHREDESTIENSGIAQTSKIHLCLHSRGYGDDLGAYIIEGVSFYIYIRPKDRDGHGSCHVCGAEDQYHHALSLSITAPVIDYQTNTIESWPIVSCSRVCGTDLLEENDIATVEVFGREWHTRWGPFELYTMHLTIPELNAEHGFDPACDGTDVCDYFGWPLLEILDPSTGEWVLNGTTSQSSGTVSDNTGPVLSQEQDSAPRGMDVAMGSIKEVQAGEAPTKTENVSVVRHDISTRSLIIMFIAIGVHVILLSSFKNYL
ncbi:hypothetical protein F5146DRAFT_1143161 [Armillaria mellea]|nr:hypothetical protein F5146DRAFT_1143161 [Armillaria mellea]